MRKTIVVTCLLVVSLAFETLAYRFICNGILANGEERSDECGVCDASNAARWADPNISLVISESPLPRGISAADWRQVVTDSLAAWNQVSGSALRFSQITGESRREFGSNDSSHEIFWITDKYEWRKLVGSGEFGTLGATLPRYSCSDAGGRVISDADLVLNGQRYLKWGLDCDNTACQPIKTTLVHELGHVIGLDHPCLSCSSSIMSARSGFTLLYPVLDDMVGLRALYPNGSFGGFGDLCTDNSQCIDGNRCVSDLESKYCSHSCRSDRDCQSGTVCRQNGRQKFCAFVNAMEAGGKDLSENCTTTPCAEPRVCAGASVEHSYCFMPCSSNAQCGQGESCTPLENDRSSICVPIKNKGELCDHRELCQDGLVCLFDSPSQGHCLALCDESSANLCESSESCQEVENHVRLCLPKDDALNLEDIAKKFEPDLGNSKSALEPALPVKESRVGCSNLSGDGLGLLVLLALWLRRKYSANLRN